MALGSILRAGVWITAVLLAMLAPHFGERLFKRAEALLLHLARRTALCMAALALTVLVSRALFLPVWEIPEPFVHDEMGYLLEADTFASGRLTNPEHPLKEFFETAFVLAEPSRMAKFPPAQGLVMALGQLLGDPWIGVALSCAALAAVLFWALRGWFPPGWALFGAVLALPLCTLSYWMNSYWGGAMAAIGGALAYGAAPRLRSGRQLPAVLLAVGVVILALSRPFEGLVALVPLAFVLFRGRTTIAQVSALALVAAAGLGFLGYYNYRVTGNPTRLPYVEYDRQHPSNPHFNILPLPPAKTYSQAGVTMMDLWERTAWAQSRSSAFFPRRLTDLGLRVNSLLTSWVLLLPLLVFTGWWRSPRLRSVRWALGLTIAIAFVEVVFYEHYAAPMFAALLILVVRGFREMRQWSLNRKPAGLLLVRLAPVAFLGLALLDPLGKLVRGYPLDDPRASVIHRDMERQLREQFSEHLVFVRYPKELSTAQLWAGYSRVEQLPLFVEWVRNGADIDESPVVWAYDLGPADNQRLIDYYRGRTVWLLDLSPSKTTQLELYR